MSGTTGLEQNRLLAAIIGLDLTGLTGFTLTCKAGTLPVVEARYVLINTPPPGENGRALIQRFELVEVLK